MTLAMTQAQRRATVTLALRSARKAVEGQLKRERIRLCEIEHKDIMVRAIAYLEAHSDALLAQARATVEQWQAQGRFGPKGGFRAR
jgi:hypothetical protein